MLEHSDLQLSGNLRAESAAPGSRSKSAQAKSHFGKVPNGCFFILLAVVPFWYGGNPTIVRSLFGLALTALAFGMVLQHTRNAKGFGLPIRSIAFPVCCFAIVIAWCLVQAVTPVSAIVGDSVWGLVADTLQLPVPAIISAGPADTLLATTNLVIVALVFLVALVLGADPQRAVNGLQAISFICIAYAAWGLLDYFMGWNYVLFVPKDRYAVANLAGFVSSTFINADHFAGLCLIGSSCAAALLVRDGKKLLETLNLDRGNVRMMVYFSRHILVVAMLLLTLWLTRSRAGFVAGLTGFMTLLAILAWRLPRKSGPRNLYLVLAGGCFVVAILVGTVLETAGDQSKFNRLGDGFVSRMAIYRAVWDAAASNLLFGTGFGAFRDAFAVYHTSELGIGTYMNAAHNVYLEAVFGLGLPMALVFFSGIGWVVCRVFHAALFRRQHLAAPVAASVAATALLSQNALDFSLQTFAVAVMFAALMGFGCAQSWSSRQAQVQPDWAVG